VLWLFMTMLTADVLGESPLFSKVSSAAHKNAFKAEGIVSFLLSLHFGTGVELEYRG